MGSGVGFIASSLRSASLIAVRVSLETSPVKEGSLSNTLVTNASVSVGVYGSDSTVTASSYEYESEEESEGSDLRTTAAEVDGNRLVGATANPFTDIAAAETSQARIAALELYISLR